MLNKVMLIGRLGGDPEIRYTQQGTPVATFSVATTEYYNNNGKKEEKTEWHRVVLWGKQAEFAEKYIKKGNLVYIEGKLQTRKWKDQNGMDRTTTEIVVQKIQGLTFKNNNNNSQKDADSYQHPQNLDGFNIEEIDEPPF